MLKNPIYVSDKGGTINSFRGDTELVFRVCSNHLSFFCSDLDAARAQLDRLENRQALNNPRLYSIVNEPRKALKELVEKAAAPYLDEESVA
ncbi:hypothetical protein [Prochlorococcus sp. MIT 1307]|uniref:hypothetical protein n=1 Tax=Prochlorococcus sp. MIT 1307 TaxID=3096219 RepID=UPI002A76672A|nr:hypothetical protein [Prochlorococcus sp. MIT 1307]